MRVVAVASLALAAIGTAGAQLRPTPTLPEQRFGQIFPRQTDLGGLGSLSPACTSALLSLPPPPTPPPDVQSYILSEGITSIDPCGLSGLPNSLKGDFSSYQSKASSWYNANKGKLTDCSYLLDLQKAYSTSCPSASGAKPTAAGSSSGSATNAEVTTISGTRTGSDSSPTNTNDTGSSGSGSNDGDSSGSSSGSGSKSLSGGAIAGIVIGAVAAVAFFAAIIIFFVWRSRRQAKNLNANQQPPQQPQMNQQPMQPGMGGPNDKPVYPYPYPPNNNYVYEMPGQQQQPVELGYNSEPVYEMPAHARPG